MKYGDAEQVLALYTHVFGETYADKFEQRWQWAFDDNLAPNDTHKWVIASDENVVGFLAAMPMTYTIGGEQITAHAPSDYMVHPDYRFHGIKLMKQFFKTCPNCVTCDDIEATIKITQWLGAEEIGTVNTYLKVLSGRAFSGISRFRHLPVIVLSAATQVLKVADAFLFFRTPKVKIARVDASDERFNRFFDRVSQAVPASLSKNAKLLEWRYGGRSPQSDCEVVAAISQEGEFDGYAVLHISSGPRPSGYLLDLQAIPGVDFNIEKGLLRYATRRMRQKGALTLRYHNVTSPHSPSEGMLKKLGFREKNKGGRILMAKFEDDRLSSIAKSASNWRYSLGDAEVSHSIG